MKPFDLEKALAGEPVVTRDGRKVKIVAHNPEAEKYEQVIGWADNEVRSWGVDGCYYNTHEHPCGLFMAEKPKVKKEGWVNVYKLEYNEIIATTQWDSAKSGHIYKTKEDAVKNAQHKDYNYVSTVKIEWEEEAE